MRAAVRFERQAATLVAHRDMSRTQRARVVRLLGAHRRGGRLVLGSRQRRMTNSGAGILRCSPFPRLHVVISGAFHVRAATAHGIEDLVLERGDAAYWPPGACSDEQWDHPCEVIGASLHPSHIRVIRMRNPRDPGANGRDLVAWHTPTPLSFGGTMIATTLDRLGEHGNSAHAGAPLFCALLTVLATELGPLCASGIDQGAAVTWSRALGYIEDHFGDPINRASVARAIAVHPNHLSRLASSYGGMPFKDALREMRLQRAAELLVGTDLPVARVAAACGYGSAAHFIVVFRRAHRVTPTQYRARNAADG